MMGLVAGFFWLLCCHLSVAADLCSSSEGGGVWQGAKNLDIEGSQENGAHLGLTYLYVTATANQCGTDCCMQLKGVCDVAWYKSSETKCCHYHCSPIEKCKTIWSNGTDVFFPLLSPGSDPLTTNATMGDGTRSKARKGAQLEEVNPGAQLKQDNTSVVARKGVLIAEEHILNASDLTNLTSADSLNATVEYVESSYDADRNASALWSANLSAALEGQSPAGHLSTGQASTGDPLNLNPVELTTTSSSLVVVGDQSSTDDPVSDLMSSGSFHLVIGLVLAFMVVLLVLGLLGKRIHDSWQRRHYSRMDFLIDGMYHGDP